MALGYVSAPVQTSKIHHQEQNTEVYVDKECLGKGVLYITEDNVLWQNDDGTGFELFYPNIQLHAISRDKNAFKKECLYMMVETCNILPNSSASARREVDMDDNEDGEEGADDNEGDEDACSEVRFCPDNVLDLEPMFLAMNQCQELHPDPTMDSESSDEDNEDHDCDVIPEGGGDRFIPSGGVDNESMQQNMQQFFTSDGQFSAEVLQQIQSGQQVHIDFTSLRAPSNGEEPSNEEMDTEGQFDN